MASATFRSPSSPLDPFQQIASLDEIVGQISALRAEEIEAIARAVIRIGNLPLESKEKVIAQITDAFARPFDFIEKGVFFRVSQRAPVQLSLQTVASQEKNDLYFFIADESRCLGYSLKSLISG